MGEDGLKQIRALVLIGLVLLALGRPGRLFEAHWGDRVAAEALAAEAVPALQIRGLVESAGAVNLSFSPQSQVASLGEVVTFDMMVEAGEQLLSNVELYIEFDPVVLQVVDASGDPAEAVEADQDTLDIVLLNRVDNQAGRIRYDAGKLVGATPSGTFRVATLRLNRIGEVGQTAVRYLSSSDVFYRGESVIGSLGQAVVVDPTYTPLPPVHRLYMPVILKQRR
jgi:hypothetical protein